MLDQLCDSRYSSSLLVSLTLIVATGSESSSVGSFTTPVRARNRATLVAETLRLLVMQQHFSKSIAMTDNTDSTIATRIVFIITIYEFITTKDNRTVF